MAGTTYNLTSSINYISAALMRQSANLRQQYNLELSSARAQISDTIALTQYESAVRTIWNNNSHLSFCCPTTFLTYSVTNYVISFMHSMLAALLRLKFCSKISNSPSLQNSQLFIFLFTVDCSKTLAKVDLKTYWALICVGTLIANQVINSSTCLSSLKQQRSCMMSSPFPFEDSWRTYNFTRSNSVFLAQNCDKLEIMGRAFTLAKI